VKSKKKVSHIPKKKIYKRYKSKKKFFFFYLKILPSVLVLYELWLYPSSLGVLGEGFCCIVYGRRGSCACPSANLLILIGVLLYPAPLDTFLL